MHESWKTGLSFWRKTILHFMTTFTQSNVPPLLSLPFSFQSGWFYLSAHYLLGHFDLYICLNRTLSRSEYLNEMDLLLRIKWKGCLTMHSNFSCKYEIHILCLCLCGRISAHLMTMQTKRPLYQCQCPSSSFKRRPSGSNQSIIANFPPSFMNFSQVVFT